MSGILFATKNANWSADFSEPSELFSWAPYAELAAVYAILVSDLTQRPRPFRPIYFGSRADIAVPGWLTSHPQYSRWTAEARRAGSLLYIATHSPPMAGVDQYRQDVVSSLVSYYQPFFNLPTQKFPNLTPTGAAIASLSIALAAAALIQSPTRRERKMAKTHRIFISFAAEDIRYRDLLVGQARNGHSPFDFVDMSVKQPWDSTWKTSCRTKIKGCDGMIALLSVNTSAADGARWEIKAAKEEGIPVLGVHIHSSDRTTVPEVTGSRVIDWAWDGISSFLKAL